MKIYSGISGSTVWVGRDMGAPLELLCLDVCERMRNGEGGDRRTH